MAILTKTLPVAAAWVEVTAALAMADGSKYVVEVQQDDEQGRGHVIAVDTDTNAAPAADTRGHTYYPRYRGHGPDVRVFTKTAGRYWWMRSATGDTLHLVATKE